jgi:hypothetical protein
MKITVPRAPGQKAKAKPTAKPPATPDPPPGPPPWNALDRVSFLEQAISQLADRLPREKGIAAVQTMKLMLETRRELESAKPAEDRILSEAEVSAELALDLLEWPDQLLELALRTYGERHSGRILLVTETHRAELGAAGWTTAAR